VRPAAGRAAARLSATPQAAEGGQAARCNSLHTLRESGRRELRLWVASPPARRDQLLFPPRLSLFPVRPSLRGVRGLGNLARGRHPICVT
jgi:hypothetical protein